MGFISKSVGRQEPRPTLFEDGSCFLALRARQFVPDAPEPRAPQAPSPTLANGMQGVYRFARRQETGLFYAKI